MGGFDTGDGYDTDTPWQAQVAGRMAGGLSRSQPTPALRALRWGILVVLVLALVLVLAAAFS